jgi:hypothetical protein
MTLIRNQAVTFILLLGYIALTLFSLSSKLHHLFDYMTFTVPMMRSDFIGFGNLETLAIHRGIYTSLGLCMIFATIVSLRRPPQSRFMTRLSVMLSGAFLACGIVLVYVFITGITDEKELRSRMADLNDELYDAPAVSITRCDIDLVHSGKMIEADARLSFRNDTHEQIERCTFMLNPGLEIERITGDGGELPFERTSHVVHISSGRVLAPGETDSLEISYRGKIEESACHLHADEKSRRESYRTALFFNIDKRHAFIEEDFVLLTPECSWYPSAGTGYSPRRSNYKKRDFTEFTLKVNTASRLTAVSQGGFRKTGDGAFSFEPELPLPGLSLAIGRYERRSIAVDSVLYSLLTLEHHDYFAAHLTDLGDTIEAAIRDVKQDFENRLQLSYPYPRLTLVEAPIQFFSYEEPWSSRRESVQPEIVFLPENGKILPYADFRLILRFQERMTRRTNQSMTPEERQTAAFKRFIRQALTSDSAGSSRRNTLLPGDVNYNLFPNYLSFVIRLTSKRWPVVDSALESYLIERAATPQPRDFRYYRGLTTAEKANLELREQSLAGILVDPDKREIAKDVLKLKGAYLFKLLGSMAGEEAFRSMLSDLLDENRFRTVDVERLLSDLAGKKHVDFKPLLEAWYNGKELPGFIISDVEAYKVIDRSRTRFQVRLKISNPEQAGGLVHVSLLSRRERRFFQMDGEGPLVERLIPVNGRERKEIGLVLDFQPSELEVNTMISQNLPSVLRSRFDEFDLVENAEPFDGEVTLKGAPAMDDPGEIIIDNEDPGFEKSGEITQNPLQRLLRRSRAENEYPYGGIQSWKAKGVWRAATHSDFFGRYVRSAYYIRSGGGERKAIWNVEIPESGYYEVYCYFGAVRSPRSRRGQKEAGEYRFIVYHDDGIDEASLDVTQAEHGWNFLGSYYMSSGQSKVELTNESQSDLVFADAIKWIRR